MAIRKESWKQSYLGGQLFWNKAYLYYTGVVYTPHGIVEVYAQGFKKEDSQITVMDFMIGGVHHQWRWDKAYRPRYIKTLARRMAAEISGEVIE